MAEPILIFSFLLVILNQKWTPRLIRGFRYDYLVRHTVFFIPYLLPFLFWHVSFHLATSKQFGLGLVIALPASLIGLAVQYNSFKLLFDKDILVFTTINRKSFLLLESSTIGSAIFEEVYYRGFVVGVLHWNTWLIVLMSGMLFLVAHFFHLDAKRYFNKVSYVILFFIGFAYAYAYLVSGSLLAVIVAHLVYNSPQIINLVLRYRTKSMFAS